MTTLVHEPVIIDVRTPAEFAEMHLPKSSNLPLGDLKESAPRIHTLADHQPVLLVCRSGKRAAQAQEVLAGMGIANTQVMSGGILACLERGETVVQTGKKAMSLERQVRVVAGALVAVGSVAAVANPWFLILPAFVGTGLVFAGLTDTCAMGMALARMPWNRRTAACEA